MNIEQISDVKHKLACLLEALKSPDRNARLDNMPNNVQIVEEAIKVTEFTSEIMGDSEPAAWRVNIPQSRRGVIDDVVFYYKKSEMLNEHIVAGDEVIPLYTKPPSLIAKEVECERLLKLYEKSNGRIQELIYELNVTDKAMNFISSSEKTKFRNKYRELIGEALKGKGE